MAGEHSTTEPPMLVSDRFEIALIFQTRELWSWIAFVFFVIPLLTAILDKARSPPSKFQSHRNSLFIGNNPYGSHKYDILISQCKLRIQKCNLRGSYRILVVNMNRVRKLVRARIFETRAAVSRSKRWRIKNSRSSTDPTLF